MQADPPVAPTPVQPRLAPRVVITLTTAQAVLGMLLGLLSLAVAISPGQETALALSEAVVFVAAGALLWRSRLILSRAQSAGRWQQPDGRSLAAIDANDVITVLAGGLVTGNLLDAIASTLAILAGGSHPSTSTVALGSFAGQLALYLGIGINLYVYCMDRRGVSLSTLGWRRPTTWWWLAAAPFLAFGAILIGGLLQQLTSTLAPSLTNTQCVTVRNDYSGPLAIVAFPVICLVAPLVEETLFRGLLYGALRRRFRVIGAVLLSAVIFSAFHQVPLLFLPLAGVGAVLAAAFAASGSLYTSALTHAVFNAVGLYNLLYTHGSC